MHLNCHRVQELSHGTVYPFKKYVHSLVSYWIWAYSESLPFFYIGEKQIICQLLWFGKMFSRNRFQLILLVLAFVWWGGHCCPMHCNLLRSIVLPQLVLYLWQTVKIDPLGHVRVVEALQNFVQKCGPMILSEVQIHIAGVKQFHCRWDIFCIKVNWYYNFSIWWTTVNFPHLGPQVMTLLHNLNHC